MSSMVDSLPDLYVDANRHFRYELSMDLFRSDDCVQPTRPGIDPTSSNIDHTSTIHTPVTITNVTIALLPDSTLDTLPSWISFNSTDWTISGTAPPTAPARITLQVYMSDSFKTSAVFKLHIFTKVAPCSIILRARWTLKTANEQHASIEFMIWVSEQGPPSSNWGDPHREDSNSHSPVGPLGIKIIVALAVALPMLLAIWFVITRYCHVIKQEQGHENQPSGKLNEASGGTSSPSPDWNGYQEDDGQGTRRRHERHSSDVIVLREPHYRSAYDDDPSVGHRDSFSQKYAAENGILSYTTAEDTEQEFKGEPSGRRSILGWIFRDNRSPSTQTSDLQSTDGTLRARTGDLADFSLKRVSVGYPFESSSFGFVGSNRSTFYDSSTTENNRRSIVASPSYLQVPLSPAPPSFQGHMPPTPEGQKTTQELDTPQPSHMVHIEPIDTLEQLEVQEEPELPVLPETTARKLRLSLRLGSRKRTICYQDQGSRANELLAPGFQSTRPCHSISRTGQHPPAEIA
ncbi:hypothetical protein BGZ81_000777 [Podila clonocystis]|nr:hypothetical protein BGZ81_000777 [Podila clonocystis]